MRHIRYILIAVLVALSLVTAACGSNADVVSDNLSKEAEKFNVQRRIVGINGITDKILFEVEGRCSLEYGDTMKDTLDVICKHGPNDYRKHYVGISDNVTFISTQLKGLDVSEYRTKIIIKPENIVPDFDLVAGDTP
jgi:hypothetical protein